MIITKGVTLKATKITKVFFAKDNDLFPISGQNMKFQIHYDREVSKEVSKLKLKEENKKVKKKGN